MEEKLITKTEESIKEILDGEITPNNVDALYKLVKTKHIAKEDMEMYGNYGHYDYDPRYGRNEYGRYNDYGARRRDSRGRYMGHEHLDRMYDDYGRYMESRERYGAEEANKSFSYMVKSLEDFIKVLHEEAETPQQKQMLNEVLQRSMR